MATKVCTKCGIEKLTEEFSKKATAKDGRQSQCKKCAKVYDTEYYKVNCDEIRKRVKVYNNTNKEIIRIKKKDYNKKNKESISKKNKIWKLEHPEYQKEWRQNNHDKIRIYNYNQKAKRKGFGIPESINSYFEDSHLHHLHINGDHKICIYIPKELHNSIWHAYNNPERMIIINLEIMKWYYGLTINWNLII